MTKQRKLTDDELQKVMAARHDIRTMCCWLATDRGGEYWGGVTKQLDAMAIHATTDGQPYVDPVPPIPDGYRKAVAGDEGRADRTYWSRIREDWMPVVSMAYKAGTVFIVPVDRTPTDEEAKSRPVVMVRDRDEPWRKAVLYGVLEKNAYPFLVAEQTSKVSGRFKYCRHLYPGE